MRSTISRALVATGLFFSGACAQNFDDHHRALQRANDLAYPAPLSSQEEASIQSLVKGDRMTIVPRNLSTLPDIEGNDRVARAQRYLKGKEHKPKPAPKQAVGPRVTPEVKAVKQERLGATARGQPQVTRHGSGSGSHSYEDDE